MMLFDQRNRKSSEVYVSGQSLFSINNKDINELINKAKLTSRNRVRFCSHRSTDEIVHEMFIVHPKDAYVRPHKHLNKSESMVVIEGEADYVTFDDKGCIQENTPMGDYKSGKSFYQSTRVDMFHSLVIHSKWLVFLEITQGPFNRKDTVFADWSPTEDEEERIIEFMEKVKKGVK
ncbi:WbuC family cupin fold metalloprotein [Candidatus Woesearchaeota archaeon]|nr:WbuC family cupin fold metalloprotein [Candidatus Woesearchaeota archaeon]